jgi:predicted phosphodiesterase
MLAFVMPACGCHIDNSRQKELSLHSLQWSTEHTTAENREWLRQLPESLQLELDGKTILLIHATEDSIVEYLYQSDEARIQEILEKSDCDFYVYGHTHYPYSLLVGGKWIINPGSVGRPKDLDPRAAYVRLVVDGDNVQAEIRRVAYDVVKVVRQIAEGGLDADFAEFLRNGGDPNASGAPTVCDLKKH